MTRQFCFVALLVICGTDRAVATTTCSTGPYQIICIVPDATGTFNSSKNNVTYAWNSTAAGPYGLAISLSCTSGNAGFTFTVKDEVGTAGTTHQIVVSTTAPDTIEAPGSTGNTAFKLNSNYESITFQCDGTGNGMGLGGNWMVE